MSWIVGRGRQARCPEKARYSGQSEAFVQVDQRGPIRPERGAGGRVLVVARAVVPLALQPWLARGRGGGRGGSHAGLPARRGAKLRRDVGAAVATGRRLGEREEGTSRAHLHVGRGQAGV